MIINPSKEIGDIMKMYRLTDGHLIYHISVHFSNAYWYSMGEVRLSKYNSLLKVTLHHRFHFSFSNQKTAISQNIITFVSLHFLLLGYFYLTYSHIPMHGACISIHVLNEQKKPQFKFLTSAPWYRFKI